MLKALKKNIKQNFFYNFFINSVMAGKDSKGLWKHQSCACPPRRCSGQDVEGVRDVAYYPDISSCKRSRDIYTPDDRTRTSGDTEDSSYAQTRCRICHMETIVLFDVPQRNGPA